MAEAAGAGPTPPAGRPWSGGGREELAAAVRRLMAATVTALGPPETLRAVADRAAALADQLEAGVPDPDPVPRSRFAERPGGLADAPDLAAAMPFDMIIGTCNPVAPPLALEFEPEKAIGRVTFPATYEGAPGCVHGAALAGAFDIVLTAANVIAGAAGPTVELRIRYRRPTLVEVPAVFEAWVTSTSGNRVHSEGRLLQDGVVTVEAFGEFVDMGRERIDRMHRRPGKGGDSGPTQ
jgi:acyl-coenzyme A thioesterase PaaI-like protein